MGKLDDALKVFKDTEVVKSIETKISAVEIALIFMRRSIENLEDDDLLLLALEEMIKEGKLLLKDYNASDSVSIALQIRIIGWDNLLGHLIKIYQEKMQGAVLDSFLNDHKSGK